MGKLLKKALRFGAFAMLVVVVFFTNVVHKLGFATSGNEDGTKDPNDLFAAFSDIPVAHADVPTAGPDAGPNCDAGPCPGGAPH